MNVETLKAPDSELLGICMRAARLSHRSVGDFGGPEDFDLARKLVLRGDSHAKAIRGMFVYALITAERHFWHQLDAYRIGTEPLGSESTMHDNAHLSVAELMALKDALPEGMEQARIWVLSYQALRHIYGERKRHRHPSWQKFCAWIEGLPYSELITVRKA